MLAPPFGHDGTGREALLVGSGAWGLPQAITQSGDAKVAANWHKSSVPTIAHSLLGV